MSLEDAARRAVDAAVSAGASDADAWAEESTSRRIRVYSGEVESLSDAGGRGIGIRAFAGARSGYAYGTDLTDEGVAELALAAREAAELADEDEHEGLPEELGTADVNGLASPGFADWTTERKVELALAVERAARAREGVTQVENAVYSDSDGSVALANSRGFAASYSVTNAWAYASAFAGEGADLMTGLGVGMGRDP
jgi:PmbA protein